MNRKNIRTIIISALVLLGVVYAIFNIDIEPAQRPNQSAAVSSTVKKSETTEVDTIENEQPKQEQPKQEQPKQEQPKQEQPKQEQPKQEQPKQEQPKQEKLANDKTKSTPTAETKTKNKAVEINKKIDTPCVSSDAKASEPIPPKVEQHVCTLEIRCDTVADTSKLDNQAVAPYVPKNGIILDTTTIEFTPGESVFDVLLRATKDRDIHMEFRSDSVYSGKYIEGINYLYEMDAGPLSGWMYKVNGQFPNYGCAAYEVNDGDAIVWMYTCDLGLDVGDNSVW